MLRTIKFILNHPFTKGSRFTALGRFIKWQLLATLSKKPRIYNFTQNSKLWAWKGLTGATGNIYAGLHEFEDMAFLLHLLRPDDLFVDVGSNIGSYTLLASAEIGCNSIAVEPVPQTFKYLTDNISLNNIQNNVVALNIGLSSKPGKLKFTQLYDTANHVANDDDTDVTEVPVDTLDHILGDKMPLLIKIDVEGFETEVLNGAKNTLLLPGLKAIIIELNGAGNNYGFDDHDIHVVLLQNGFKVMRYLPFERRLIDSTPNIEHNTLYVKDVEFVTDRLNIARTIYIQNKAL